VPAPKLGTRRECERGSVALAGPPGWDPGTLRRVSAFEGRGGDGTPGMGAWDNRDGHPGSRRSPFRPGPVPKGLAWLIPPGLPVSHLRALPHAAHLRRPLDPGSLPHSSPPVPRCPRTFPDHAAFTRVLQEVVTVPNVDYAKLQGTAEGWIATWRRWPQHPILRSRTPRPGTSSSPSGSTPTTPACSASSSTTIPSSGSGWGSSSGPGSPWPGTRPTRSGRSATSSVRHCHGGRRPPLPGRDRARDHPPPVRGAPHPLRRELRRPELPRPLARGLHWRPLEAQLERAVAALISSPAHFRVEDRRRGSPCSA
jgi:hypothetical protein